MDVACGAASHLLASALEGTGVGGRGAAVACVVSSGKSLEGPTRGLTPPAFLRRRLRGRCSGLSVAASGGVSGQVSAAEHRFAADMGLKLPSFPSFVDADEKSNSCL